MEPAGGAIAALILIPVALIYPLARLRNARVRWWIGSVVCCVPLLLPFVRDPELVRPRWGMALLGLLLVPLGGLLGIAGWGCHQLETAPGRF